MNITYGGLGYRRTVCVRDEHELWALLFKLAAA